MIEKAWILAGVIVSMVAVVFPWVQFFFCVEPELELMEWVLVKIGLVHEIATCPTLPAVAMEVLRNAGIMVLGTITGYGSFRRFGIEREQSRQTGTEIQPSRHIDIERRQSHAREQWMPYDREILESNLREGFGRRRHSGDFYRRHSRTWDELMWFDRDLLAARNHREGLGGNQRRETP